MVKDIRVTYRRRHSYNTVANSVKVVKTTGGRLTVHYRAKKSRVPHCGDCGCKLNGIPSMRPKELRTVAKRARVVNRAYGGSRCAKCVHDRIVRAFLIEEQKIVKKVLADKSKATKA